MDIFKAMKERRSIRNFLNEIVPKDQIMRMVEAASWAPTAVNAQNFRFIVIQDKETLVRMKEIVDKTVERFTGKTIQEGKQTYYNLFAFAPAAICVVGLPYESIIDNILRTKDPNRYNQRRFAVNPGLQGVSAGITQLLLAAHALGYGTCWTTGPLIAKAELELILQIRQPEELVAIIALGKPASDVSAPPRKAPEEIVTFK